jgi:MFS transporter, PHS family, inorganic phosphate transporter
MLGLVYWQNPAHLGVMPGSSETAIKVATPVGTVVGQVGFGILADMFGRRRMYGIELIIIVTTTIAASLSSASAAFNIVGITVFWRVLLGVGVGGDYPLSAIITSEYESST